MPPPEPGLRQRLVPARHEPAVQGRFKDEFEEALTAFERESDEAFRLKGQALAMYSSRWQRFMERVGTSDGQLAAIPLPIELPVTDGCSAGNVSFDWTSRRRPS